MVPRLGEKPDCTSSALILNSMACPLGRTCFLFGTEIDYQTSLLESGFVFNNPNVTEACGCGESIKFKDVDELAAERQG